MQIWWTLWYLYFISISKHNIRGGKKQKFPKQLKEVMNDTKKHIDGWIGIVLDLSVEQYGSVLIHYIYRHITKWLKDFKTNPTNEHLVNTMINTHPAITFQHRGSFHPYKLAINKKNGIQYQTVLPLLFLLFFIARLVYTSILCNWKVLNIIEVSNTLS